MRDFGNTVRDALRKVHTYEDELARAVALSVIPEDIHNSANEAAHLSAALGEDPVLDVEDALAIELLIWFKRDFFHWVNNPNCSRCDSTGTIIVETTLPNAEEAEYLAGRTEVYVCRNCSHYTRFPRYNDPIKLLETRKGRCGEWANAFTLCCRAVGLDARLVVDWTDHIWSEYYSTSMQRWIHLDPCEAAYDKPLIYSLGWGKKLSYCIAIGRDGIMDVTKRYTRDFPRSVLPLRTDVSEEWLESFITSTNNDLRARIPFSEKQALEARDRADRVAMEEACARQVTEADQALPGRQTGSDAWINSRGEGGSTEQKKKQTVETATRYSWAKDEHLLDAVKAFDGLKTTKWLDFGGPKGNTWLEYRQLPEMDPIVIESYALTSANDAPERDPCDFTIEAYNEEKEEWEVINQRSNIKFLSRGERLKFKIADAVQPARRFRLKIGRVLNPSAADSVQLACFELFTKAS